MLVARALKDGARSRMQVAQTLAQSRTVEGAGGTIGIGPQGMQRQLFLLRLSNGTISEVTAGRAAPAAPPPPDSLAGDGLER